MTDALDVTDAEVCGSLLGGKYLIFLLDGQEYALDISRVREIVGTGRITPSPEPTPHLRGVMNLRGKTVPVVDLRQNTSTQDDNLQWETCTIIALTRGVYIGIIADKILEVCDIDDGNIRKAPPSQISVPARFISAVANVNNRTVILLNISALFDEHPGPAELVGDSSTADA